MYKFMRGMLGLAENVGEIKDVFMGDYGSEQEAVWMNGFTKEGKRFHLELTITKEVTQDGT